MPSQKAIDALKKYRADVKAGLRPRPERRKPVKRFKTICPLDGSFCTDRNKRIVVAFHPGRDGIPDTLELKPERTKRAETITVQDVYRYAMKCRVNRVVLEKARAKKDRKQERLARERLIRAERRLFPKCSK